MLSTLIICMNRKDLSLPAPQRLFHRQSPPALPLTLEASSPGYLDLPLAERLCKPGLAVELGLRQGCLSVALDRLRCSGGAVRSPVWRRMLDTKLRT